MSAQAKNFLNMYFGNISFQTKKNYLEIILTGCDAIFTCNLVVSFLTKCPWYGILISGLAVVCSVIFHILSRTEKISSDEKKTNILIHLLVTFAALIFMPLEFLTCGGLDSGMPICAVWGLVMILTLCNRKSLFPLLIFGAVEFCVSFIIVRYNQAFFESTSLSDAYSYVHVYLSALIVGIGTGATFIKLQNDLVRESDKETEMVTKLEDISTKDVLTGLYNRQYLVTYTGGLIQKVRKGETVSFCVMTFGIDNLDEMKENCTVSDMNETIQNFTVMLKKNLGKFGLLARYGENEFTCILNTSDETSAFRKAEQLRVNVNNTGLCEHCSYVPTISGGIAKLDPAAIPSDQTPENQAEVMLSKAYNDLFLAMKAGGDQISWHNGGIAPVCYNSVDAVMTEPDRRPGTTDNNN